jgi:hypothetical protein
VSPSRSLRAGWLVFGLSLSLYAATTGGSMATDIMSYEVTKAIVEHGSVAMSYNVYEMDAHRGVDGRYYAPYGLGHAVYSVPFYAAARAVERATGMRAGKPEALTKAGFVAGSAVAAALTVWIAFLFALRLTPDTRAAVATSLTLGFGTLLWPYAKFGFSAPLGALCVMLGTYGVWVGVRQPCTLRLLIGGIGFGAALLVRHELTLLGLAVGAWLILESRDNRARLAKQALVVATPVLVALVITGLYNQLRFGNPLDTGYLRDETVATGSWWDGLIGQLFSPGRSVFLYSPPLAAGVLALADLWRRVRATAVLLGGQFLTLLGFYASFTHWDAERSYGPRYLLPVIPLLVLPLAPWFADRARLLGHRLLVATAAVGMLVQLPGVLVDFSKVNWTPALAHFSWEDRRWQWEASGLRINAEAALKAVPANARYLAGADTPPSVSPAAGAARDFSEQFAFSLDFWWVYAFYLGLVSASAAVALGVLQFAAAGVCGWRLSRVIRTTDGPAAPTARRTDRSAPASTWPDTGRDPETLA